MLPINEKKTAILSGKKHSARTTLHQKFLVQFRSPKIPLSIHM